MQENGTRPSPGLYGAGRGAVEEAVRAVREEYENSPEYILGCELIDDLTGKLGISLEEAAAMLSATSRPKGLSVLSARAAETLTRLEKDGKLALPLEEYLADGEFIKLLRSMPADLAVRVYDAEAGAKNSEERMRTERERGMADVLEKLRARKALPRQMKAGAGATSKADYASMSSEEFAAAKRRLLG